MAQMTDKEYVSVAGVASALGVAAETRSHYLVLADLEFPM